MKITHRFTMSVVAVLSLLFTAGCSSSDIEEDLTEVVEDSQESEDNEEEGNTDDKGNSEEENKVDNTRHDLVLAAGEAEIVSGYNKQAINLLHQLAEGNTDNVYTSPVSLNILLSMFANGVTGDARSELLSYLGASSISELNTFNTKLMDELVKMDKESTLHIANSLWAAPGFSFLSSYRDLIDASYHGSFYSDVALSTDQGRNMINQWCSDKTAGLIPEFLERPLDSVVRYFIVNALYFKGVWSDKFVSNRTSLRPFTAADGTVGYGQFMEGVRDLMTFENEGMLMLELPFGNKAFVLDILMPAEGTSVNSLLTDSSILSILNSTTGSRMTVRLPKFKIETKYDYLVTVLNGLGLTKLFNDADFSAMTSAEVKNANVIKQKNVFEIDEEGAKAATVTGEEGDLLPVPTPTRIVSIDRPFMFIVRETSTGLFVSLGIVNKIEK